MGFVWRSYMMLYSFWFDLVVDVSCKMEISAHFLTYYKVEFFSGKTFLYIDVIPFSVNSPSAFRSDV
ncbi:hypothetical protein SAMN05444380_105132 [Thermophagus xiamenensis]|uniref:Uncharacterized protein n=1 Tax=Thermophagus xiamenensis TaxID=385682 RepID=A0A1I1X465_9BACT|nr:hypothetical protein SAMN05444380_105132 [Thermophagus xiamenensis]